MSTPRHFLDLLDVSARELRGMLASGLALQARPHAGACVLVINELTRRSHACQDHADEMTREEHRGAIQGKTVAWSGDATNVLASWMHAADRFDFRLRVATPPERAPSRALLQWVERSS